MLSALVDLGYVECRLAVASLAGFKPAPRSKTQWTLLVLIIGIKLKVINSIKN
jgi:hypothetical protein